MTQRGVLFVESRYLFVKVACFLLLYGILELGNACFVSDFYLLERFYLQLYLLKGNLLLVARVLVFVSGSVRLVAQICDHLVADLDFHHHLVHVSCAGCDLFVALGKGGFEFFYSGIGGVNESGISRIAFVREEFFPLGIVLGYLGFKVVDAVKESSFLTFDA